MNLYAFVGNNPVSFLDFLGLRDITPQEQGIIDKLNQLADGAKDKDPEFTKAMKATIDNIKSLIASVKGPTDPANLRIGMDALKIWADPQKAKIFAHTGKEVTCNKYVATAVGDAGFSAQVFSFSHLWHDAGTPEWHNPKDLGTFKVKWIIRPIKFGKPAEDGTATAIEWEQPMQAKGGREPAFGDVISYPQHVGIFLGNKLYVSSTTWEYLKNLQGTDVVIHFRNDNQEQIYRSPE